jgi:hypothetical protein
METKTKLEAALAELIAGKSTAEIVGPDGLLKQLTKALLNQTTKLWDSHAAFRRNWRRADFTIGSR